MVVLESTRVSNRDWKLLVYIAGSGGIKIINPSNKIGLGYVLKPGIHGRGLRVLVLTRSSAIIAGRLSAQSLPIRILDILSKGY